MKAFQALLCPKCTSQLNSVWSNNLFVFQVNSKLWPAKFTMPVAAKSKVVRPGNRGFACVVVLRNKKDLLESERDKMLRLSSFGVFPLYLLSKSKFIKNQIVTVWQPAPYTYEVEAKSLAWRPIVSFRHSCIYSCWCFPQIDCHNARLSQISYRVANTRNLPCKHTSNI